MKTAIRYTPVDKDSQDFPNVHTVMSVAKQSYLDISTPFKATLTTGWAVFVASVLAVLGAIHLVVFIVGAIVLAVASVPAMVAVHAYYKSETPQGLGRRLDDEIKKLVKTYDKLLDMRSMLPEGGGYSLRITQFGRLCHELLGEVERLPRMGGENKNFHRLINEVQTKMQALINSGEDLADLIATRRVENTLESIKFLGIDEYTDHMSVEMATFRALAAAPDPDPKKIVVGGEIPSRKNPFKAEFVKEGDMPKALRELNAMLDEMDRKGTG